MVAANAFMLLFRFLHIVAGAFWFGSAWLFSGFIGPAADEVGPSAGPLLTNAIKKRHAAKVVVAAGVVTVLAGLVMYWHDWHLYGSFGRWIGSSFGTVVTIGAIAAVIAATDGVLFVARNVERLLDIGGQLATEIGPPSTELVERMGKLQRQLKVGSIVDLVLLTIAVSAMASARYW